MIPFSPMENFKGAQAFIAEAENSHLSKWVSVIFTNQRTIFCLFSKRHRLPSVRKENTSSNSEQNVNYNPLPTVDLLSSYRPTSMTLSKFLSYDEVTYEFGKCVLVRTIRAHSTRNSRSSGRRCAEKDTRHSLDTGTGLGDGSDGDFLLIQSEKCAQTAM